MPRSKRVAKGDRLPTVVVYGNCQADATTTILGRVPGFNDRFRAVFYPSYDHPTQKAEAIPQADLDACEVLFEQYDQAGFAGRSRLPADVRTIKFPSTDFNLLWPFNCTNPFNAPDAANPLGPFPYGDRIILNCVRQGMSVDAILEHYFENWDDYKVDLHRLAALETARVAQRNLNSDVKLGAQILEHFTDRRLFWTVNHPTAELLAELLTLLVAAAFEGEEWIADLDMHEIIVGNFSPRGPLGGVSVPIHPGVAKYLGLTWYDTDDRYRSGDGRMVTYAEYFRELTEYSVRRFAEMGGSA